ncbi:hypothetical protein [Streptomyces sp. NPDC059861]
MRPLSAGELRRTTSFAHRTGGTTPAADVFRALLRGAFAQARQPRPT